MLQLSKNNKKKVLENIKCGSIDASSGNTARQKSWSNVGKREPCGDVDLCACVVHDKKDDKYYVFLTTDTNKTAKQIINTYELRPEIEEDFRQIKDFWKLEDFKSRERTWI